MKTTVRYPSVYLDKWSDRFDLPFNVKERVFLWFLSLDFPYVEQLTMSTMFVAVPEKGCTCDLYRVTILLDNCNGYFCTCNKFSELKTVH